MSIDRRKPVRPATPLVDQSTTLRRRVKVLLSWRSDDQRASAACSFGVERLPGGGIRLVAKSLRALHSQDRLVAARDLGLVEGGIGAEQGFVVGLRARAEERATDADGGMNPAGPDGV